MKVHALLFALVACGAWSIDAVAAPPDFSICDGQAGVALGLCHGGVAVGCADSKAGTQACQDIEGRYRTVTGGQDAPWISARYPVHTLSIDVGTQVDLESGVLSYPPLLKPVDETDIPSCGSINACDQADLFADVWKEMAGDSGNPFFFWQKTCTDPSEPGFGGAPEYVVLRDAPFGTVTSTNIDQTVFLQAEYEPNKWGAVMPHLRKNDTLIVHTCAGNYFKVGNQVCNFPGSAYPQCDDPSLAEWWTRFDYQMLRAAP